MMSFSKCSEWFSHKWLPVVVLTMAIDEAVKYTWKIDVFYFPFKHNFAENGLLQHKGVWNWHFIISSCRQPYNLSHHPTVWSASFLSSVSSHLLTAYTTAESHLSYPWDWYHQDLQLCCGSVPPAVSWGGWWIGEVEGCSLYPDLGGCWWGCVVGSESTGPEL